MKETKEKNCKYCLYSSSSFTFIIYIYLFVCLTTYEGN